MAKERKHKLRYRVSHRLHHDNWLKVMINNYQDYVDKYGLRENEMFGSTEALQRAEARWARKDKKVIDCLTGYQDWHKAHWEKLKQEGLIK